jgi:hypothetical protein
MACCQDKVCAGRLVAQLKFLQKALGFEKNRFRKRARLRCERMRPKHIHCCSCGNQIEIGGADHEIFVLSQQLAR